MGWGGRLSLHSIVPYANHKGVITRVNLGDKEKLSWETRSAVNYNHGRHPEVRNLELAQDVEVALLGW